MSSSWMLRAASAPERFLDRGFARFVSRSQAARRARAVKAGRAHDLGVVLPPDLDRFIAALEGTSAIADFVPRPTLPKLAPLLTAARRGGPALVRLMALLADAVPFGETGEGEVVVYFLSDQARAVIGAIHPTRLTVRLICQGAAELAVMCSLLASGEEPDIPPFGIAVEEGVLALVARARLLAQVLVGTDAQVRAALRALAVKPLDLPPPEQPVLGARKKRSGRTTSLALGALVETFFRANDDLEERLRAHEASSDDLVRQASALLLSAASAGKRTVLAKELGRRREIALRTIRAPKKLAELSEADSTAITRRIVARFDDLPPNAESFGAIHEREETLLALTELGNRRVVGTLLARAITGDAVAVDMLAALGDRAVVPHLLGLLQGAHSHVRLHEAAIVRALVALGATEAVPALQMLLEENPMNGWREGLERGVLVRELVGALGELQDQASAPQLLAILESTSQEYRPVLPVAAHALGRMRHVPALPTLERLLSSPKSAVTSEAIWAVGSIGQAHVEVRERAAALLDALSGLEPGAEATRLTALAKMRSPKEAPKTSELRAAIDRALWEPAFRQEETSRRRAWGFRALEELATIATTERRSRIDAGMLFLGHDTIRHFVTRDDHRVRNTARSAFAAWGLPVPKVRSYYSFLLPELERDGGLDALLEAVRDPLGIFRYNVATRLAELGDPRSIRPLAEATGRLFAEPLTSTYEYDDAPPQLVSFIRALAKLNRPQTNDVLIEGLRSGNHQVRAVIAENAPDDQRFVPELMAMLGDPKSFLRSRAEKSLMALGVISPPIEPGTTEIAAVGMHIIEAR